MGVRDRIASAYLTVVGALSVIRPSSKWWTSESKLNVVVHEGKVGRHSQAKYLVTIRHGKEKKQTKKKKSDSLLWEEAAEFSRWKPKDPLILKLRKVKRCKDTTIAELSIDVATVLESADGLPTKWWYAMKRLDKSGRQKEDVFLQITVTVDGQHVKSGATQEPAKPAKEAATTAAQEKPQITPELKANSPTAVSTSDESDKASTKREDKPSHDERRLSVSQEDKADNSPPSAAGNVTDVDVKADTTHRSRDKTAEVPHVPATVDGPAGGNDTGPATDPTRLSEKMAAGQEDPESSAGDKKVFKDAEVTMAVDDGSGRSQDHAKPDNESSTTAAQDKISTKTEDKSNPERRSSGSQEGETGTSDSSRTDTSPPSAAGDVTDGKPASSTPTSCPPVSVGTPDKTGTSGHGEGDVKSGPECRKDKAVEVSEVPAAADCPTTCMGNIDSGRSQAKSREDVDMKEVMTVSDEDRVVPHLPAAMGCPMDDSNPGRGPTAESASTKKTAMTVTQEKPEPRVDPKDAMTEMYLRNLKRILARREFPQHLVPKYAWMTAALTDTETEQPPADSNTDTDGPGETAQGGGEVLPTANQHPEHKEDDPEFEKMRHVWKIEDLWDEFTTMREQADELVAYVESLRAKLAASVPHVLQYPVIKNLAAYIPERKPYDLPDTEGLSIDELEDVKDNLSKLLKDEENRAKFLKKWYIEEMLRVAMNEAPQVLGPQK
uniref:C2 domain-containing protein n=1 Tax=Branchiostoma floridae TaxID=7739 RepID=C3YKC3_BRAFL|eukprot:XP_002603273.1 hypothetical protein BRAFLDRAFT_93338 [Branchiostoma floridae]